MSRGEWTETDPTLNAHRDRLLETLRGYGRVAVAFSGGVDSTVVAQAAYDALGDRTIAVTAVSDSLASGELEEAEALARQIGIRHRVIRTDEFADPNYVRNQTDRCYFCKSELYGRLSGMLETLEVDAIASGANMDDMGDHRPGMWPRPSVACGTRSRNAGSPRRTSGPWPRPGACPSGTSRRHLASPAGSLTAKKSLPSAFA
ncbi:MAG: asparagine synthase-related protein [Isosphaeraceae bacterium]